MSKLLSTTRPSRALIVAAFLAVACSPLAAQTKTCEDVAEEWTEEEAQDVGRTRDDLVRASLIWCASESAVMKYTEQSVSFAARGYRLGLVHFVVWYQDEFVPSHDDAPAIEKVFSALVREVLIPAAVSLAPLPGVASGLFTKMAQDAFDQAAGPGQIESLDVLERRLDLANERLNVDLHDVPRRFEADHPSFFEEVLTAYQVEELATPGIHESSDFNMGVETRALLASHGFPEPTGETTHDVAERVIYPLVLRTQLNARASVDLLEPDEHRAIARYTTLRSLYPDQPRRYCSPVSLFNALLRPNDCR